MTPYGVSRYVLDHLPDIGAPDRAQLKLYRGGHMFYFDAESRARLHRRREELLSGRALNAAGPIAAEFHQGGNRFPAAVVESGCHFATASGECHGSASAIGRVI